MPNIDTLISIIQSSQKTLFILCGFPYAGKSFVAKETQKCVNIVYVSIDKIFHKHGFDWNINALPNTEEWQRIFNESYEITKKSLSQGENVLYDSTNQTITSRDKLREIADSVEARTYVIYVKSPIETVWKRWKDSQEDSSRSTVSKELVRMTIDMFEEPTESESVILINN